MMLKRVDHLQFGVLSPDVIRDMSVAEITEHERYEKDQPKRGGLMDLRMGTIDWSLRCDTCDGGMSDCPGHFGHVELVKRVYNVGFMTQVLKILRAICMSCSRLLVDPQDAKFQTATSIRNPKDRFKQVYQICLNQKSCHNCGRPRPTINRSATKLIAQYGDDRTVEVSAEHSHSILSRISDADCVSLGLDPEWSRPEWFIITVLPVSPPAMRPSVAIDRTSRGEDDITHKLVDIIKTNNQYRLKEKLGSPSHVLLELHDKLQFHVSTMFENPTQGYQPAVVRAGSRAIKALQERLKTKQGRVRGNLMGKRVDFSGRTVITPDPNIAIDEVGVPKEIAMNLTFPTRVTPYNMKQMRKLVSNGPKKYPGAKYILNNDGHRVDLRYVNNPRLEVGYVVERHLQNGDPIVFNRQPSLHKMSMMGHKVRVMSHKTFRLNLSVTTPYNADFDGDEMNLHVPQSLEAKTEVQELMMVPTQIITPQANRPVIGLVQDALLGSNLLTQRDTFLERDLVMNIMMWWDGFQGRIPTPAILKPRQLWTGKQIFSLLLDPDLSLETTSNSHDSNDRSGYFNPNDTRVVIRFGQLLSGMLDKKTLGTSQGSLVHIIVNEHGTEAAKRFLGQTQLLVNHWLLHRGFSVGISDTIADPITRNNVNQTIEAAKTQVEALIQQARRGQLQAKPGMNLEQSLESGIRSILNQARDNAGRNATSSLHSNNRINRMVIAGSKGSSINISQIMACVGQQSVEGQRIPFKFLDRSLPHFCKHDDSPESRGFVENSFISGLTPQEFFFHAMGGREGLIDTAVKTSDSGYIQRRLIKAMEDIQTKYDGTVRNSIGDVLQFCYGEDGLDAIHVESQTLETLRIQSPQRLSQIYEWPDPSSSLCRQEFQQILTDRDFLLQLFGPKDTRWPLPVHLKRLIHKTQTRFGRPPSIRVRHSPDEIIQQRQALEQRLQQLPGLPPDAVYLFSIHLRSMLASKRIVKEYRLGPKAYQWLLNEIERRYEKSMVQPGEMVGAIAAQSIGEPATQVCID
jgi:DNA-directed RNA polymerase II subunit RPB1